MPLSLLLTRPKAQSKRFAKACRDQLGAAVRIVISPILQIEQTGKIPDLTRYRAVILTSENGAQALGDRAEVAGLTAYCVGTRTAETAARLGMSSEAAGGTALALVEALRGREGPLLHVRGRHARGDVALRLSAAGTQTDEAVLYDQKACRLSPEAADLLSGSDPVLVPLFSPRSAALVSDAAADATAPLFIAAMSAEVAAAWSGPVPARHAIAAQPEAAAMLDTLAHLTEAASP